MNKEELNCYHKIFTIIRKTDLLNLDEKDELHLFLMKFKDENKELHNKIDKAIEKINFYKNTEWGLRSLSILETFEEILKGDVDAKDKR